MSKTLHTPPLTQDGGYQHPKEIKSPPTKCIGGTQGGNANTASISTLQSPNIDQKYMTITPLISPPFSVVNVNGHSTPPKPKDAAKLGGISVGSGSNSKSGIDGRPLKGQTGSGTQYTMYRQSASTYFHHNNTGSERRNSSLGPPTTDEGGSVSGQVSIQKGRQSKKRTNPLMSGLLPGQYPPSKMTRHAMMVAQMQKDALITSIYSQQQLSQFQGGPNLQNGTQQFTAVLPSTAGGGNGGNYTSESRNQSRQKNLQLQTQFQAVYGGTASSNSLNNLPKISQSVKNQNAVQGFQAQHNFGGGQNNIGGGQVGQVTKKPTLMAGSTIASVKQQISHNILNGSLSGGGSEGSGGGRGGLQILPPRRHMKKNSLSELYSIYLQAPNNFRSHSHMTAPQMILPPTDLMVGLTAAAATRNFEQLRGGYMSGPLMQNHNSIQEVSEPDQSQSFIPHQQETIALLEKEIKRKGGNAPPQALRQKNLANLPSSIPMSSVTESQNEDGSTNGGSSAVPPRPHSKNQVMIDAQRNQLRMSAQAQAHAHHHAAQQSQLFLNNQIAHLDPRQNLNFAFSNSFNTSLILNPPVTCDPLEVQKLLQKLQSIQDVYLTMKSKKRKEILVEAYESLKKLFTADKTLVDIFDLMCGMSTGFIDKLLSRKRKFKQEVRETGERLRNELDVLEKQLFTTKVETETLKIDKRYFEEQVSELQKKNQEMISNIENIMSDPKRHVGGSIERRPSDALLPHAPKEPLAALDKNIASQGNIAVVAQTPSEKQIDFAALVGGGPSDESLAESNQRLLQTLQKTVEQNNQLLEETTLLNQHLEYARNKEGKLMYLIFKLHKRGYPVNQVFESEVKAISTRRFANGNGGYQLLSDSAEGNQENMGDYPPEEYQDVKGDSYISFDSQASYSILHIPKKNPKGRPPNVPSLDFDGLPVYISSSSESSPQEAPTQPIVKHNNNLGQGNQVLYHQAAGGGGKKSLYKEDLQNQDMMMTETPPMDANDGRSGLQDDEEEDDDEEEEDEGGADEDDEYDDQLDDGNGSGNAEEQQRRIEFEKQMMDGRQGQNSEMMTPIQGGSSSMMNSQFAGDISNESPINKKQSI